jgi:sugar (pentulose or hexulose) kinase
MVGGPSANPFWTTVIEEITGIRTEIRHGAFAGARGAAIVAGIGAGIWKDEAEALSVLG